MRLRWLVLGVLALSPLIGVVIADAQGLRERGATAKSAIDRRALDSPARDRIFACGRQVMGVALDRPWLDRDGTLRFADKPVVPGEVRWRGRIEMGIEGDRLLLRSAGVPTHATGTYPVPRDSAAFGFDRNPNAIREGQWDIALPLDPAALSTPGCLPMGPIGIALTGAMIFNALDADLRDAVANELFDACEGHPAPGGLYHYHHWSPCMENGLADQRAPVVGYAFDGFPIVGPRDVGGRAITNAELDECHGHVGPLTLPDGRAVVAYHYHFNREFPYSLGCYRGTVAYRTGPPGGGGPPQRGPGGPGGPPPRGPPPPR